MSAPETTTTPTPPDCLTELEKLYNAIMLKMQGRQRTRTRYEDQESEYSAVTLKDIEKMYKVWWNQCGQGSGFPDVTQTQLRGSPAHVRTS